MACSPSARGSRENGLLICIEESEPKKRREGVGGGGSLWELH